MSGDSRRLNTNAAHLGRARLGKPVEKAFETAFRARYKYVFTQVKVSALVEAPQFRLPGVPHTGPALVRGGAQPTVDFLVGDSLDNLKSVDIKLTKSASFTAAQRTSYPKLVANGGEVVRSIPAKNGMPALLKGTKLNPSSLHVVLGTDFEMLLTRELDVDRLVAARKVDASLASREIAKTKSLELKQPFSPEASRFTTNNGTINTGTPKAAEAGPGRRATVGDRTAAAAADEAETLATRRAGSLAVREGGEAAVKQTAVRAAARAVGRILISVIGRLLMALNIVGFAFFIVDIVVMITEYFAEQALANAIEKALKTHAPAEITAALDQHKDEIARHYARAWLNRGNKSEMFLYLSPRMTVTGGLNPTTASFVFDAHVTVKSFANDLVSTRFYAPERKDIIALGPTLYEIQIRWSVDQPIYTPFDIYLAFTEFFVEHVVDSWAMHYATGRKLSPSTVTLFHSTVDILAQISATVKFEPWFGYERGPQEFSPSKAAIGRWEALQKLSKRIDKELIPKVSVLESQGLINVATARWDAYWSPLRSELDPRGEESLVPAMRRIAIDMKYLDAKHLDYERFETLQARVRGRQAVFAWRTGNSIEAQKMLDLREFLKPVQPHLPKLATREPFILEVPAESAGSLVLDQIDE